MAISFRASTVNTTPADPMTVNVPTGTQDGDFLLMVCCSDSTVTYGAVTGWTPLGLGTESVNIHMAVYYRIASSEPASYSVNPSGNVDVAYMLAFNPNGGTSQYDDHSYNFSDTGTVATLAAAAATAQSDGAMVGVWCHDNGSTISSAPAGMTGTESPPNTAGSFAAACYYQTGLTAGDYTPSLTWGANEQLTVILVTFSAPGAGGGAVPAGGYYEHYYRSVVTEAI